MPGPIAHLDLDAFFASVELSRRPELKGLPVIVAGSGPRAVVTTASYEARLFGIGSAMPASKAKRLCRDAVIIAPNFDAYREVSRAVMLVIGNHIERFEQLGIDEAFLDLEGLHSPKAAMRRLVGDIYDQTAMRASIGIGPNRLVAKVASDAEKPNGFVVLTADEARHRFAGSPVSLVPGIGPRTSERLGEMAITTLAQLRAADEDALIERFGARQGPALIALACFEASAELVTDREAVSESRETTFDRDINSGDELETELKLLAAELARALNQSGRRGRTIRIKVRLDDWTTVTRARTIPTLTNEYGVIIAVAIALLREYAPQRPVRLVGVGVAGFVPRQQSGQLELPLGLPAA
ncbi:MAG: DNA polymerase IV [Solirubrobacteraceae bacterium]|jgi:DNA polymerase IV|nr:DNA polymerase IV [Solirubrobacteraceae bacterium]MDP4672570.1 DNA polymerase IV [Solirubrobacteraceae bacterium]MDP4920418.1 DNA polymerase IV [Solirubrobacteraceae bacterium]